MKEFNEHFATSRGEFLIVVKFKGCITTSTTETHEFNVPVAFFSLLFNYNSWILVLLELAFKILSAFREILRF